jgi:hypothetical protein
MKQTILQAIEDAISILENKADKVSINSIGQVRAVLPVINSIIPDLKRMGYKSNRLSGVEGDGVFLLTRKDIRKASGYELAFHAIESIGRVLQGDENARDKAIGCLRQLKVVIDDTRRTRTIFFISDKGIEYNGTRVILTGVELNLVKRVKQFEPKPVKNFRGKRGKIQISTAAVHFFNINKKLHNQGVPFEYTNSDGKGFLRKPV